MHGFGTPLPFVVAGPSVVVVVVVAGPNWKRHTRLIVVATPTDGVLDIPLAQCVLMFSLRRH